MQKFAFAQGLPTKLDVEMLVPDSIDLTSYRGKGPQPGEDLENDEAGMLPNYDTAIVETLKVWMLIFRLCQ